GGEIDVLDPGGFGAVTITKNLTIDGTWGSGFGSILASATNGVNINDSATGSPNTIIVTLRKLSINGAGTTLGLNGINFVSGKAVNVENCQIFNFSQNPINLNVNNTIVSTINVVDTNIYNVNQGIRANNSGSCFAGAV